MRNRFSPTVLIVTAICQLACGSLPIGTLPLHAAEGPPPVPVPITSETLAMDAIEAHLGYVTEHAVDEYGPKPTQLWLSHIDTRTSRLPETSPQDPASPATTGRDLATANLYRDQPTMLAAIELGRRTGCKCYSESIDRYLASLLELMPDAVDRRLPINASDDYHVTLDRFRPASLEPEEAAIHTPAWEILWRRAPKETERAIRTLASDWLVASAAAESQVGRSFELAQRAIAVDSLAWLIAQRETNDPALLRMLEQMVTAPHRRAAASAAAALDPHSLGATGSWIQSLIRASRSTGNGQWIAMAQSVADQQLALIKKSATELQASPTPAATTEPPASQPTTAAAEGPNAEGPAVPSPSPQPLVVDFKPPLESSLPWAEACFSLWEVTGSDLYREEGVKWADALRSDLTAGSIRAVSAEDYGRSIHLLLRAANLLQDPAYREAADQVAQQAMTDLYEPKWGMFRSRQGIDRCDATDGPGFLMLALLALTGPDPTSTSALHF